VCRTRANSKRILYVFYLRKVETTINTQVMSFSYYPDVQFLESPIELTFQTFNVSIILYKPLYLHNFALSFIYKVAFYKNRSFVCKSMP